MEFKIVKSKRSKDNRCFLREEVKNAFDLLETLVSAASFFNVVEGATFTIDLSVGDSDIPSAIFAFARIKNNVWDGCLNDVLSESHTADKIEIVEWLNKWLESLRGANESCVFQIEKVLENGIAASCCATPE